MSALIEWRHDPALAIFEQYRVMQIAPAKRGTAPAVPSCRGSIFATSNNKRGASRRPSWKSRSISKESVAVAGTCGCSAQVTPGPIRVVFVSRLRPPSARLRAYATLAIGGDALVHQQGRGNMNIRSLLLSAISTAAFVVPAMAQQTTHRYVAFFKYNDAAVKAMAENPQDRSAKSLADRKLRRQDGVCLLVRGRWRIRWNGH